VTHTVLVAARPTLPADHAGVRFAADLRCHGDRPALITSDGSVTYVGLADRVAQRVADRHAGGTATSLVVCELTPTLDSVISYLAALADGRPVLVIPPGDQGRSIAAPYRDTTTVHPDLALLLSTSGSTGSPKLVRLSRDNVQTNAEAIAHSLGLTADDVGITSLPLHYTYGLSVLHSHLAVGAPIVLTDLSVVDRCFWDLVDRHGVTGIAAVPYTFELLDRSPFDERSHPSLHRITQAGGRLDPASVRRWAHRGRDAGWDLVVMYGQTEATARMTVLPPELVLAHPSSVGRAIPGGALRLEPVDHTDTDVGELVYSGPNVMLGYAERASDLARGRDITELHTGDLARIGVDGLVEIVGRLAGIVKPFGLRVDVAVLERHLGADGYQAVVVGDDAGLVVAASTRVEAEHAARRCVEITGLPRSAVVAVEGIAHTPTGKIDRAAILSRREASPGATGDGSPTVRQVFGDVLGRTAIDNGDTFVSLGGDSLSYVEASIRLEALLGDVPAGWHMATVAELEKRRHEGLDTVVRRPRRTVRMDTTVVLRAIAISMVVGHHTQLIGFRGGAHTMLVIGGYNFARFHLDRADGAARHLWRATAAVAVPSVAWILLQSVYWDHGWKNFVLLHNYLGPRPMGPAWRYWYIEVLVQTMVVLALLLSVRRFRAFEKRHGYVVAAIALSAGLVGRFVVGAPDGYYDIFTTHTVIWLFALGWLIQRSTSLGRRAAASAIAIVTVPGFFAGESSREVAVVLGILALTWIPSVRVPRRLVRPIGAIAAASLAIYLTHWQVYHPLRPEVPAIIVAPLCIGVGIGVWMAAQALVLRARAAVSR
jgi:acyl-CoA synthetase (AMP-forming)/AMP-acid ligase II/peptidoglycan/LPS O-acetylase OafA/YrhL